MFLKPHFGLPVLALLLVLTACTEPPLPAPVPPQAVLQGNRLHFPPGHPQLALLGLIAAKPVTAIAIEMPAKLVWNEERTQRVYAAFAGRVGAIHADVGQVVKAGAALAQLASPDFGMAQADTAKALADEGLAQKTLARQRELFEAGIVARKDLELAQADVERSQAERERASARTQLYSGAGPASGGVNQQLSLKATLGGVVVERNLNPGQELRPDQSGPGVPPLFVISDPSSLWVQIDMREAEAGTLRKGASFELSVPGLVGQRFEGKVVAVSDAIDPASRTLKVRGLVHNPERLLKSEMLATAKVQRELGAGVTVPATAVILRGSQQFVFVQTQPGVFEVREVHSSHEGSKDVVLSKGLEVGEQVVFENALLLGKQFNNASHDAKPTVPTVPSTVPSHKASAP